jgi:pimeloyl-ACP methyl ester carboxylesterase
MESDGLAALKAIAKGCELASACKERYGDVMQKSNQVSAALATKPAWVTFPHPRTQGKMTLQLTAEDFASIVHLALYNRELASLLPQVISDAQAGDYQLFASLIYLARSKSDLMNINFAMHYSVVCSEDYPQYKDRNPTESNVFLQSKMVQKYAEICSQWPVAAMPNEYWQPVKADHPILMLSGAVDPVTPPHWGETAKTTLPQARHLVAPGGHHIITQEGCTSQLIAQFIAKGEAQSLDGSCIDNIKPLAIHIPPKSNPEATAEAAPITQGARP